MSYIDEHQIFYGPHFRVPARTTHQLGSPATESGDKILDRVFTEWPTSPTRESTPFVLLKFLENQGMISLPYNYNDKLQLRQIAVYHGLPDIDSTTGYLDVSQPFKAAVQRRMTAYIAGVHTAASGRYASLDDHYEIQDDVGGMESVKACLTGDYTTSYWRTYVFAMTSIARKSHTGDTVEVLYSNSFDRIADFNDTYFYDDGRSTAYWNTDTPLGDEMKDAKQSPRHYAEPFIEATDEGGGYRSNFSAPNEFTWAMLYRYGYSGTETVDHIALGWVASPSRRDTFVSQIMTNLHSLVSSATGIPKEYRVRMQQSPSFDPGKLTAMPTAPTATTSSPITSPSGGSY